MKKYAQPFALLLMLAFMTLCQAHSKMRNGVVAVVDQEVITAHQLDREVAVAQINIGRRHQSLPDQTTLRQMVLNQMINNILQLKIADQNKISVTNKEVDHFIDTIAQENHMTASAIYDDMNKAGYTHKEAFDKFKEQLIILKIQHLLMDPKIHITPSEVAQLQAQASAPSEDQQFHLHDLLIDLPEHASPAQHSAAMHFAIKLRTDIIKSHQSLEKYQHDHPSSSMHFHDLGMRTTNDIPDMFSAALENMGDQDISYPIETSNGIHLIQMVGMKDQRNALSKQQAANILYQRQFNEHLEAWITQLHAESYIQIMHHE